MSKQEFKVQYKDSVGTWCNMCLPYSNYNDALERLISEAKQDPEYTHRIVRMDVVGYITGRGECYE